MYFDDGISESETTTNYEIVLEGIFSWSKGYGTSAKVVHIWQSKGINLSVDVLMAKYLLVNEFSLSQVLG